MDPPAYTPTIAAAPTSTRRSIEDTRALILANASIIKPSQKHDGTIELVVGKWKPPTRNNSYAGARTFTSTTSNITIRVAPPPPPLESSPSSSPPERRQGSVSGVPDERQEERQTGRHYAALVSRSSVGTTITVLIQGEPQDTVEEALEWMLDRTEIVIDDLITRLGRQAQVG